MAAILAQSYPVICEVRKTRKIVLSAIKVHYGYMLMHDDSDSGQAALLVTGDDADRFAGIALETVNNASDVAGADGTVYVEVAREGSFIAELDTTPAKADLRKPVFGDGDTGLVSLTEGTGPVVGIIEEWENVGDPLGRANAVRISFSPEIFEAIAAGT